jgi:hypothetical protein
MEDAKAKPTFVCDRCGYSTSTKGQLKQHLCRKHPCNPIVSDISQEATYEKHFGPKRRPIPPSMPSAKVASTSSSALPSSAPPSSASAPSSLFAAISAAQKQLSEQQGQQQGQQQQGQQDQSAAQKGDVRINGRVIPELKQKDGESTEDHQGRIEHYVNHYTRQVREIYMLSYLLDKYAPLFVDDYDDDCEECKKLER